MTVNHAGRSRKIVWKLLVPTTSGLTVLGCARGTTPAGRAALPGGFGDQGGVSAGRWQAHGHTGGYRAVRAHLQPFRTAPAAPAARPPSPRTVTSWILAHPDTLSESERLKLKAFLAGCPELDALTGHARAFGKVLTQLQIDQLPLWIKAVRADDLPSLHTFVNGRELDLVAVTAAHTAVELRRRRRPRHRIKMIKRQMYGRARFGLLRKRVLLASRRARHEVCWSRSTA
ncbi:hypothetical protein [Streptomyces sp. NPDC086838]|uniref:hypothetical protein n=1 Tax=Streptomyces sp. NPDC086838 TaxID=3365762 RepID=UPI00382EAB70